MEDVFLGLGSNVGDRLHALGEAVRRLRMVPETMLVKVSSVYETEPVGVKDQGEFLNAAVALRTSAEPEELYSGIKLIEREMGRKEGVRWGPREIDIDILLFGDRVINTPSIVIPHAEMLNRKFVLQPLAEIGPNAVHPRAHKTIKELFAASNDANVVRRSAELTHSFFTVLQE